MQFPSSRERKAIHSLLIPILTIPPALSVTGLVNGSATARFGYGMYQGRNFGLQFRLGAISARSSFGQFYTAITITAYLLVLNYSSMHLGIYIDLAGVI